MGVEEREGEGETVGYIQRGCVYYLKGEPALHDDSFKVWPREWVVQAE